MTLRESFVRNFDMIDMGELEFYLHVRVTRTKKFIQIFQAVYIHKVLDMFADLICKPHTTRKCLLPSDAVDRIAQDQGELTAQERM